MPDHVLGSPRPLIGLLIVCLPFAACQTDDDDDDDDSAGGVACEDGFHDDGGLCVPDHCGSGTWGDLTDVDVHVDVTAESGGDGSADLPFRTIQEGLDAAGDDGGGRVALAAGTYPEMVTLDEDHNGTILQGRCLELVVIDGNAEDRPAGVLMETDEEVAVEIWDLTVTGGAVGMEDPMGISAGGVAVDVGTLSLHRLDVVANRKYGVVGKNDHSHLTLDQVTVRGTLPVEAAFGRGIGVGVGATLQATNCIVEDNSEVGVFVMGSGAEADLTDTTVRGTTANGDDEMGFGLGASAGGVIRASGCVIEGNTVAGVAAINNNSDIELTDSVVRGTLPNSTGMWGRGIDVEEGARATVTSCEVDHNFEAGIYAYSPGSVITVTDTIVSNTLRHAAMTSAFGIASQAEAVIEATNLTVVDSQGPGLFSAEDSSMSCTDCILTGNAFAGAVVWAADLVVADSQISGTIMDANEGGGMGIYAATEGVMTTRLTLTGTTIEEHSYAAVWLLGNGEYVLQDNELYGGSGAPLALPDGSELLLHGNAVYATFGVQPWDGETGLLLEGNAFRDSVGPALFLDDSSATLSGNQYSANATDLLQQNCDEAMPPEGLEEAGDTELCPQYEYMTVDFQFRIYMEDV